MNPAEENEAVERYREWLRSAVAAPAGAEPLPVDFPALLAQFTALRHEVNLQTKAARALAEAVQLAPAPAAPAADDAAAKGLLDVADALAAALKQVEKWKPTAEEPGALAARPGILSRVFGLAPPPIPVTDPRLPALAGAAAEGYAISLRKAERALQAAGYEVIAADGLPFDAACMEAVETTSDAPHGFVAGVLRRGYRKNGQVVRFVQVKVGR
jgi:molecular chaperone GrpE